MVGIQIDGSRVALAPLTVLFSVTAGSTGRLIRALYNTVRLQAADYECTQCCIYSAPSVGLDDLSMSVDAVISTDMRRVGGSFDTTAVAMLATILPDMVGCAADGKGHIIFLERPEYALGISRTQDFVRCLSALTSAGHTIVLSTRDDNILSVMNSGLADGADKAKTAFALSPADCIGYDLDDQHLIYPGDNGFNFANFDKILGQIITLREDVIWG